MHKPTLLVFLGASLTLALALLANDPSQVSAHPVGSHHAYTLQAEDEWGSTLRTFHHRGQTFVLGSYGQRYNLRVRNQTAQRVEAVVTVDGRDVVSGRTGDFEKERGYVIAPYGTLLIEGFRTSLSEVAAFRFTDPGDSYSARMGTPQHVGVIGVAFFPERAQPRPQPLAQPSYSYDRPERRVAPRGKSGAGLGSATEGRASAPSASRRQAAADATSDGYAAGAEHERSAATNRLGTQYGEAHTSRVETVRFRRAHATQPSQVITLRYDDDQGLLARGIRVYPAPVVSYGREPSAFPGNRFAPPPP